MNGTSKIWDAILVIGLCIFSVSIYCTLVEPNLLSVEETETVELYDGNEYFEVEMPTRYTQLPVLRMGLAPRVTTFIGDDYVTEQIAERINASDPDGSIEYRIGMAREIVYYNVYYVPDALEEWKLPWETLRDGYGDCEDFSILLTSILYDMGIDSVFLCTTSHAMVGIPADSPNSLSIEHDGKWYTPIEPQWTSESIPLSVDPVLVLSPGLNQISYIWLTICVIMIVVCIYGIWKD